MKKVIITTCSGKELIAKTKGDANVLFNHIGYEFIIRHKDNPFLSQFYHGEKGIVTNSAKYRQIEDLKKRYSKKPLHELLGAKIYTVPMDGRKREAKKLTYYSVNMLF